VKSTQSDPDARWSEVRDAVERAKQRPLEVVEAVASAPTRQAATAALSHLLELDEQLADQLLDLHVSDFVATRASG
jgi:hypothetical protein